MTIRAIIFDVNGTLIDINTDEGNEQIYRAISHFLKYPRDLHQTATRCARPISAFSRSSAGPGGAVPEFDVVGVWRQYLETEAARRNISIPKVRMAQLPHFLAEMYRGISLNRLELYPEVREVLDEFKPRYRLGAVSDAQSAWAVPELRAVGLADSFYPIVVSGDLGYRKPDPRIFALALRRMHVLPEEAIFVGNDMYRDVYGARQAGMRTVFFATNQGQQRMDGVEAHYNIYRFGELRNAVQFFEQQAS
jgi:putative hydrolase of the HAD superfamily